MTISRAVVERDAGDDSYLLDVEPSLGQPLAPSNYEKKLKTLVHLEEVACAVEKEGNNRANWAVPGPEEAGTDWEKVTRKFGTKRKLKISYCGFFINFFFAVHSVIVM